MVVITFITLLISILFGIIADYIPQKKSKYLLIILFILSILVAGFRIGESMPDYLTYVGYYNEIISDNISYFIEISFVYIVKFSNFLVHENIIVLFLIYAIIGVSLKFYLINKLSSFWIYSVIIYISNYFIVHEMIQIRAGVASGFILLSLIPIYNRNFYKFFLLILCASFFHYSSVIFLFLWFLQPSSLNNRNYLIFFVVTYILHFTETDPISLIFRILPTEITGFKSVYLDKDRAEDLAVNVFGIFIFTRIIVFIYFLYFSEHIFKYNKYIYIILKFYAFGIMAYILLANFPEISVRLSYTLMSTEILLVPTINYTIKEKSVSRILIFSYAFLSFVLNVYFTSYFNWE